MIYQHLGTHTNQLKYNLFCICFFHPESLHVTANHLLFAFATNRGYVTGSGEPDLVKSARLLLKDYVAGKL